MPTYEYICEKCGHEFELRQSISEPTLKVCPASLCSRKTWGKGKVKRQIGAGAGLLFKGSGFYITDYRSENYKTGARNDTKSSSTTPAASSPASSTSPSKEAPAKPAASSPKPKPA